MGWSVGGDTTEEEALEELAEFYAEVGLEVMLDACGNAGQESIIGNAAGDWEDACYETAMEADNAGFSTDHDEAVSVIVDLANEWLDALADKAQEIMDIYEAFGAIE